MEWYKIGVDGQRTLKFPDKVLPAKQTNTETDEIFNFGDNLGAIIKRGEWVWLVQGCALHILSTRNGQLITSCQFSEIKNNGDCFIKCVEELFPGNRESVLLAVCIQDVLGNEGRGNSIIALYSVDHSRVLSYIEMKLHVTCARFMNSMVCRRSLLQNFDGCLVVGSEEGILIALDLNIQNLLNLNDYQSNVSVSFKPCHIVDYSLPLADIHRHFQECQKDGTHFGLQMEVIESASSVQCMKPIDLVLGLAVGYEDGRLAFYDLAELQVFHVTLPQLRETNNCPVMKIDFLEPPDDPRPCLYVWALHEGAQDLTAVLHLLTYDRRMMEKIKNVQFYFFESFRSSHQRLFLTLESGSNSSAVACQSISKEISHGEDGISCLCAFFWHSPMEEKNRLLIFDLNQWYKEEMPMFIDCHGSSSCLAGYQLDGAERAVDAFVNPSTIAYFNSMQRFEEHFYPNSISFDCSLLLSNGYRHYNWEGAQNRFINILRSNTASLFLEPELCFKEIVRTRLMPQFLEMNIDATFSMNAKYELILSVALENNCLGLLRDCARCWSDGSFQGAIGSATGLSLSTLTEWIWKRATDIKARCDLLCRNIFDGSGHPLDNREQKELGFLARQLKLLSSLLSDVIVHGKANIPHHVYSKLKWKHETLQLSAEYHEVILWLLNIGLLPELNEASGAGDGQPMLYPYKLLNGIYVKKRSSFANISDNFASKKTGSCRLLYIDAFIEHECRGEEVRAYWLDNDNNGLYPPKSIESLLRIFFVANVEFERKCAILLYFFLDLHMTTDQEMYRGVVSNFIKFPSVFKLSASLIKTVQAFWNLDHGHFLPAVDEFVTPINNNQNYPQWLVELLIEALLAQNAANLALRILESRTTFISPILKLQTFLANDLISEAFHFARSQRDRSLLRMFFNCCLHTGKFGIIRDLALTENEGQLVQDILRNSKAQGAENLHFVYLLQKSKYLEAVSYMDELARRKNVSMRSNYGSGSASTAASNAIAMDTPNLVLSAFNTTMTPVTQNLTDVYFRIRDKIKKKDTDNRSPVPFSCQLIKQNANDLLGGIYHSSALSAHFATYWEEMNAGGGGGGISNRRSSDDHSLANCNNAPFLRKPQHDSLLYMDGQGDHSPISYPQKYKAREKRSHAETIDGPGPESDPSAGQPPRQIAKRRRLLGEEIVNDLSHFMNANKNSRYLNASITPNNATPTTVTEFTFQSTPKPDGRRGEAANFLSTPYRKESTRGRESPELHGILKTTTTVENSSAYRPRASARREMHAEEEKSLRFQLPDDDEEQKKDLNRKRRDETSEISSLMKSTPQNEDEGSLPDYDTTEIVVEIDQAMDEDVEEDEEADNARSPADPCVMHKVVTEAISEASNASSGDDFYSPLPSQNTSLAIDSGNPSDDQFMSVTSEMSDGAGNNQRSPFSIGPQARKPLSRLSGDRWLIGLTPPSPSPAVGMANEANANCETADMAKPDLLVDHPPKSGGSNTSTSSGIGGSFSVTTTAHDGQSTSSFVTAPLTTSSLASRFISEFEPKVSSSRMSETQSKFTVEERFQTTIKYSECTTIVDDLTHVETMSRVVEVHNETAADAISGRGQQWQTPQLDSTLEMSPSVFTAMETTSPDHEQPLTGTDRKDTDDGDAEGGEEHVVSIVVEKEQSEDGVQVSIDITGDYNEQAANPSVVVLLSSSSSSSSLGSVIGVESDDNAGEDETINSISSEEADSQNDEDEQDEEEDVEEGEEEEEDDVDEDEGEEEEEDDNDETVDDDDELEDESMYEDSAGEDEDDRESGDDVEDYSEESEGPELRVVNYETVETAETVDDESMAMDAEPIEQQIVDVVVDAVVDEVVDDKKADDQLVLMDTDQTTEEAVIVQQPEEIAEILEAHNEGDAVEVQPSVTLKPETSTSEEHKKQEDVVIVAENPAPPTSGAAGIPMETSEEQGTSLADADAHDADDADEQKKDETKEVEDEEKVTQTKDSTESAVIAREENSKQPEGSDREIEIEKPSEPSVEQTEPTSDSGARGDGLNPNSEVADGKSIIGSEEISQPESSQAEATEVPAKIDDAGEEKSTSMVDEAEDGDKQENRKSPIEESPKFESPDHDTAATSTESRWGRSSSVQPQQAQTMTDEATPAAGSAPPDVVEGVVNSPRNLRGISEPPRTFGDQSTTMTKYVTTYLTRSRQRPASKTATNAVSTQFPDNEEKTLSPVESPDAKPAVRSQSVVDSYHDVDSPSMRTRSRMRLSSIDSEASNVSLLVAREEEQSKSNRKRTSSISSSVSAVTPKKSRRQTGTAPTSSHRSRPQTPSSQASSTKPTGRRQSIESHASSTITSRSLRSASKKNYDDRSEGSEGTPRNESPEDSSAYAEARRLTRSQLAMMERAKTAAGNIPVTSRPNRRLSMAPSDDNASVVSQYSTTSSRRITRQAARELQAEREGDSASVISSVGSERVMERRSQSKDTSMTLETIPETEMSEDGDEKKKRVRKIPKRFE